MTPAELCRENILATYLSLATALPEAEVVQGPDYAWCLSDIPLALCNFAIDFRSDRDVVEVAEQLHQIAEQRPVFRIFLCDGDRPSDLSQVLRSRGMTRYAHLASLMSSEGNPTEADLQLCESHHDREDTAAFMVANFFWRRDSLLRDKIVASTVNSPHRLYRMQSSGQTVAAVMITETPRTHGLYNLCVDPRMRNRGLGSQIVAACRAAAVAAGKPLALQADHSLAGWYAKLGFHDVGKVETIGLSAKNRR